MKIIEKYFIAVLILSFHIPVLGQFNTLTYSLPKKIDNLKVIEHVKETGNQKPIKNKKSLKEIFNMVKKTDLKKELDSLKTLLKEKSSTHNKKWNTQKLQDSLILVVQNKMLDQIKNNKNQLSQYSLVNEARDMNYLKIVMP